MRVSKWGNSLAVRLPAEIVDVPGQKEGDEIGMAVAGNDRIAVRKSPSGREVLERLRALCGRLPADIKVDLEANERRRSSRQSLCFYGLSSTPMSCGYLLPAFAANAACAQCALADRLKICNPFT